MGGGAKGPDPELTRLQKEQLKRVTRQEAEARRAQSASMRAFLSRGGRRSLLASGTLPAFRAGGGGEQETLG